jgi:hypothetical protein
VYERKDMTEQLDITQTICRYAWDYPVVNFSRHELRNCCRTSGSYVSKEDLALGPDLFKKFKPIIEIKTDLLRGIRSSQCETCWITERAGSQSPRLGFEHFVSLVQKKYPNLTRLELVEKLKNLTDSEIQELANWESPNRIEIMLSNTCDLKCLYCNHVFSSQWAAEKLKYREITDNEIHKPISNEFESVWWEWFHKSAVKTVKHITFVGGEPLLNEKTYEWLDRLLNFYNNQTDYTADLFIVTNFNCTEKLFNRFMKFVERIADPQSKMDLGIGISFESIGDKNEFIRTGLDWDRFDSNIKKLLEYLRVNQVSWDKIFINALPAFNCLSLSDLPNYITYIRSLNEKYRLTDLPRKHRPSSGIEISFTHVANPERLSPFILTNDYIKHIDHAINLVKELNQLDIYKRDFVNYLLTLKDGIVNNNEKLDKQVYLRKRFIDDITQISARRNLDLHSTFPEMQEFFDLCKSYA